MFFLSWKGLLFRGIRHKIKGGRKIIPPFSLFLLPLQFPMNQQVVETTIKNLQLNHFEVFPAQNIREAQQIFLQDLLPALHPETVSWGDSETLKATGILEILEKNPEITLIRTFGPGMSRKQKFYRRRLALQADLFLTGSNAITRKGQLVNLDMMGNRIGGITFGPKQVVLFVGINKIVEDLEAAMHHIRSWTAPQNILRHEGFNTPCRKTGTCMDCRSPFRICNTWAITEKSFPPGRIKIILIYEKLGL